MTLIAAVLTAKSDCWIVASDRRLTVNGQLYDDGFNKAIFAGNERFKCHVAFTGLARASKWNTQEFLEEKAQKLLGFGMSPDAFASRLCDALNEQARKHPNFKLLSNENKFLKVVINGFEYRPDKLLDRTFAIPFLGVVENIPVSGARPIGSSKPTFHFELKPVRKGFEFWGAKEGIRDTDHQILESFLEKEKPLHVLKELTIERMRIAAERLEAEAALVTVRKGQPPVIGAIGPDFSCVVLPAFGDSSYENHTLKETGGFSPTLISNAMTIKDAKVWGGELPIFKPPPMFRRGSADCPCGSGAKFRHCHGRKGRMIPTQPAGDPPWWKEMYMGGKPGSGMAPPYRNGPK